MEPILLVATEKSVRYAFLTLFVVALYTLLDGLGVKQMHPLIFIYCIAFTIMTFFTPYVLLRSKADFKKEWLHHKNRMLINGAISFAGYALILIAFNLAQVSYVVGLRQLSIVFAVLLGGHVLKEEYKLIRFLAASLIFMGAFLITMG